MKHFSTVSQKKNRQKKRQTLRLPLILITHTITDWLWICTNFPSSLMNFSFTLSLSCCPYMQDFQPLSLCLFLPLPGRCCFWFWLILQYYPVNQLTFEVEFILLIFNSLHQVRENNVKIHIIQRRLLCLQTGLEGIFYSRLRLVTYHPSSPNSTTIHPPRPVHETTLLLTCPHLKRFCCFKGLFFKVWVMTYSTCWPWKVFTGFASSHGKFHNVLCDSGGDLIMFESEIFF